MTAALSAGMDEDLRLKYAPEHGGFIAAVTFGDPSYTPKAPRFIITSTNTTIWQVRQEAYPFAADLFPILQTFELQNLFVPNLEAKPIKLNINIY